MPFIVRLIVGSEIASCSESSLCVTRGLCFTSASILSSKVSSWNFGRALARENSIIEKKCGVSTFIDSYNWSEPPLFIHFPFTV